MPELSNQIALAEEATSPSSSNIMSLINLPTEILLQILEDVILMVGLATGTSLRLVCRKDNLATGNNATETNHSIGDFDQLVEDVIFRLPNNVLMCHNLRGPVLVKILYERLKVQNADNSLCRTIKGTVDHLDPGGKDTVMRKRYTIVLIKAAAVHMSSCAIFHHLSPSEAWEWGHADDTALIAAIAAKEMDKIESILKDTTASTLFETLYFGHALSAAATFNATEAIPLLLRYHNQPKNKISLCRLRLSEALSTAASYGRLEFIKILLREAKFTVHDIERACFSAIRSLQEPAAILLVEQHLSSSPSHPENDFWLPFACDVAKIGCRKVLEKIMGVITSDSNVLARVLENACKFGHHDMACSLLSKFSHQDLEVLSGSLFWAGRSGNIALAKTFHEYFRGSSIAQLQILAGTISGEHSKATEHLLQMLGIISESIKFTDLVHQLLPDLPPPISRSSAKQSQEYPSRASPGRSPEPVEHGLLKKAIWDKSLAKAVTIICNYGAQHPQDDLGLFSDSFLEAARMTCPEIFLYLRDHRAETVQSSPLFEITKVEYDWIVPHRISESLAANRVIQFRNTSITI
ncbi:hypothetical protein BU24DRAFT_495206 [Aaosphaeria arxii CBS 175.79]|uniref:Uncharacterized protein n=1 Tax=Aaosphaeria arxii CBS 175.79 TaxID=1450172 RepID=A0A6A5XGS4_9PLEO|nr:uncharacterized protein BU24DRAFT_495206 [Aaosphaeria arxii CBS 175.79]KAF2012133.1 hypothetical protein BU24DRAFT_495206 [Aaosphaeria arxii CBS 175.79]